MIAPRLFALVAAGALAGGCPADTVGIIDLELTTAPGSPLLDSVTHLRVTLTAPRQVIEADRTDTGFDLALEVDATGELGSILVEAFDANGLAVAGGQSPPFAVAAIDARIAVYLAPAYSLARAPSSYLDEAPPIRALTAAPLTYGAILAGGLTVDAAGAPVPSGKVHVYNAFDHTLMPGRDLPAPREGLVMGAGARGAVFMFGGRDAAGQAAATLWVFDTTVPPSGGYVELGTFPALARSDQRAVQLAADTFVITGAPPLDLRGATLAARGDVGELAPTGAATTTVDRVVALFASSAGELLLFRDNAFIALPVAPRPGAAITALPGGLFGVVGGTVDGVPARDVLVIDASTGATSALADALLAGRLHPQLAVTSRHVVVAGGMDLDGAVVAGVEVLDARSLAPVTVVTTSPPPDAQAIALPNDQVMFVGSSGDGFQLFTPPPPVLP
ncbi:MAG: hypothetical protein M3680_11955 [Myxococcota bacterium]|nr:hypothetical protein [Myxococcota bacterium]